MRSPFHFAPDEYVSLGDFGEYPIEIMAWVEWRDTETQPGVFIISADVLVKIDKTNEHVSVMPFLLGDLDLMRDWQDKIAAEYLKKRQREWDEGA